MMPKLFGLTGAAGCGKDTIAQVMIGLDEYEFTRVAFADPLKDVMRVLGIDGNDRSIKELPHDILCGKSPRYAMQTLGTEWGRDLIGPDIWVRCAKRKIELAMASGIDVVVTDVRFDEEADMVRSMGGCIVHVVRPGIAAVAHHRSEIPVTVDSRRDLGLCNDGDIDALLGKVSALLRSMK
jgi:hypothetical protein